MLPVAYITGWASGIVESYLTTNPIIAIKDLSALPHAQLLTDSNYEGRILR